MGATDAFYIITIADFLSIVNETHQSILSDDVLEHYGETRNPTGFYNGRVKFSAEDEDYAPTFFSKLERELEAYKGGKLGAASVESYLRGRGVKEEEIKWSGVRQFLEGKKSVTKDELLDFVRANRLEVKEETLGGPETLSYTDEERDDLQELEAEKDSFLDEAAHCQGDGSPDTFK